MVQIVPKGVISTPKVIHFQTPPEPRRPQKVQIQTQPPPLAPAVPSLQQRVQPKRAVTQSRFIVLPSNETYEIETIEQVPTPRTLPVLQEAQLVEEQVLDETIPQNTTEHMESSIEFSRNMTGGGGSAVVGGDLSGSEEQGIILEISEENTRRLTENGQVRYFCPQCNVRYTKYKYLKTHIKDCGTEFQCNVCGAKFKQRRTYVAHAKQKHDQNSGGESCKIELEPEIKVEKV